MAEAATPAPLEGVAAFAASLVEISRPIARQWFRQEPGIEKKTDASPVTIADKAIEAALREAIEARFPDHGIIGEEHAQRSGSSAFTWVIDPIDGTRSFSCGNPLFGTLVAVLYDQRPVIGVIDLPALDQTWLGVEGEPSQLNGHPVATANTRRVDEARLTTTSAQALGQDLPRFQRLATTARVTNFGGDCANYAHLSSGWCDIVAESNLNAYDIMAAIPIITGAGGCLTQWDGSAITLSSYDGTALATASSSLHDEAVSLLS